jgi:hypothetical protein
VAKAIFNIPCHIGANMAMNDQMVVGKVADWMLREDDVKCPGL